MQKISIKNIGRVKEAAFPYPDGGGVVVLYGRNGAGKSTALKAIERMATNRGDLPVSDGAKSGYVDGLGVHITVGKSTRRTGQLEVTSLEGRFDVSTFVDPGLKSADAADTARIRALCSLLGLKGDHSLFAALVGGSLDDIASPSAIASDDLVDQAAKMKRDFEAAARKAEEAAQIASAKVMAVRQEVADVPMDIETDADKLQDELRTAIEEHAAIAEKRRAAIQNAKAIEQAKADIQRATSKQAEIGTSAEIEARLAKYASELDRRKAEHQTALVRLAEAQQQARDAEKNVESCSDHIERTRQALTMARDLEFAVDKWSGTLNSFGGGYAAPSDEEEALAASKVKAAQANIEAGAIARKALGRIAEADELADKASDLIIRSANLRNAAKQTDEVLSSAIDHERLRIVGGRIVLDTDRGETPFAELPPGERWPIAIEIASKRVGRGGLIVIPQEAWEGLDDQNRRVVADTAKACEVVIYTAEAADSNEIVADVLESAEPAKIS